MSFAEQVASDQPVASPEPPLSLFFRSKESIDNRALRHLAIAALGHHVGKHGLHTLQFGAFAANRRQVPLGQHTDLVACAAVVGQQGEKRPDLLKTESEIPAALDKAELAYRLLVIGTMTAAGARRRTKQADPFVVADRLDVDAGQARQLTD